MSVPAPRGRREASRGRRRMPLAVQIVGWSRQDDGAARSLAVPVFFALFQLYAVAQGNYAKSIWFGMFGLGVEGA